MKRLYFNIDKENNKVILDRKDFDYLMSIGHYNDKAIEHIEHELNGHILLNDEITWNKEFYTNGKLDYRKLLISLLQQTLDILKGSDKDE